MRDHLVIVGGGQAAAQAAGSVRQAGFDGRVSMITAEASLPYQRPPLSKAFLAGKLEQERLLLKPAQFYQGREIEIVSGTTVEALDIARSAVRLDSGQDLGFSHLLLATGAEPRRLGLAGSDLAGIHYLRSTDDAESIRRELEPGARLLIVGAGYIGLEVAAVAAEAGLSVTVLEAEAQAMARTVAAETARFFVERHRRAGVEIRLDSRLESFYGDGRVRGAVTASGDRIDCDFAIIAIGIEPRTGLAEAAGIEIDNGIAIDAQGRTSAARVYAAGDCASFPHPWAGRRIRLESVQNAIELGKTTAAAICGGDYAFDALPWFWSDQYDLKLQIAGLSAGYDQTVIRGDTDDGSFSVFYLAAGRVIAVDAVNDARSFIAARKHLAGKPAWPVEALADADFDLETLES